ncbi:DUF707 domain-containing protein [Acinetobacter bereziniae]|uniref:DUF707 domain-containing protein n=3 Tax=Acinetobacter bereziniae TaxID=106648 RepID=A0A8I1DIT2_ACIBZ|nr:DUF707 domain-containing protein [Acinetobacter bereziniae]MEC8123176.1 DUF707 domain-containing protein [Pseudomonadota bacterium]ENV90487.1 hypothetical protein F938_04089 [Acinetobacter bereziniae LMG 1003 = CIP 70.12]MDG3557262.1 DUF707 domain-containing protein [Acinetobacter bereziniae]MDP6000773.1 DUF707 domain-containing protein [Acinetobacter bereziniae]QQC80639.1 DUF707 domain-containing protein [Acinetobacter bereziniae]
MSLSIRLFNKIHHFILGLNRINKQKKFLTNEVPKKFVIDSSIGKKKILLIGIYLTDYPNQAIHLMEQFSKSNEHTVDQKWVAIGGNEVPEELKSSTILHLKEKTPKFKLLNQIFSGIKLNTYDYLIVTDDDIVVHDQFLDVYIDIVDRYNLKIAQPSRTRHSFNIHKIVLQNRNTIARVTNFVEIGPIFSFHSSIFQYVLPFPDGAEMGWGLDYIWPKIAEKYKFKIGIVDEVAVDHSYRPQSKTYSNHKSFDEMNKLLCQYNHNYEERKKTIEKILFK